MKRIFIFIISLIPVFAKAQTDSLRKSLTIEVPAGLRVGLDVTRFALKYFQPYRTDVTVNLDARYNDRLYVASDLSYNRTEHSDTNYSYRGSGMSATIGVNYNLLKKQVPKENFMIYAGIRYGLALFNYEVPDYTIHNSYWGNTSGRFEKMNATAHWVELTVGLKVEVLKNFYLGWSLHERILVNRGLSKRDAPPLIIPGFGKGNKGSAFDVQYGISYLIPMWKVKQKVSL